MTRRIGNVVVIEDEEPSYCEVCRKLAEETRPYGKNGARVCFECGMKPENAEHLKKAMDQLFGVFEEFMKGGGQ